MLTGTQMYGDRRMAYPSPYPEPEGSIDLTDPETRIDLTEGPRTVALDSACYHMDQLVKEYNNKLNCGPDNIPRVSDAEIRLLQMRFAPQAIRYATFIVAHPRFHVLTEKLQGQMSTQLLWWSALEAELKQEKLL